MLLNLIPQLIASFLEAVTSYDVDLRCGPGPLIVQKWGWYQTDRPEVAQGNLITLESPGPCCVLISDWGGAWGSETGSEEARSVLRALAPDSACGPKCDPGRGLAVSNLAAKRCGATITLLSQLVALSNSPAKRCAATTMLRSQACSCEQLTSEGVWSHEYVASASL